jgi:4-hydroxy 2-oxovalerate aldolase
MDQTVHLLETTLRDGSYEVDFQLMPEDTALIAGTLDRAGVRYIEVSAHGFGFRVHRWNEAVRPKGRPSSSDEDHLSVAQRVIKQASYGVIYGAGAEFVPIEELEVLPRFGVSFVRFAFLPDQLHLPQCLDYIDRAKSLGLTVSLNLMQTYVLSPSDVAKGAAEAARRGADWFYVVDSAGGMTPSEVQEYVRAIRDGSGLRVGVHTHNNTGLAVANSLAAVAAGATLLDGTLQGIGRATGNASTEHLVLLLQRLGHEKKIDTEAVMRLGDVARSLFAERGNDPTNFASGAARLHSRYIPGVLKTAEERGRAPRTLLVQVGIEFARRGGRPTRVLGPDLLDAACEATPSAVPAPPSDAMIEAIAQGIERVSRVDVQAIGDTLFVRACKRRKKSVLHLVPSADFPFAAPLPWEGEGFVGLTVPITGDPGFDKLVADRLPDLVMVDEALPATIKLPATIGGPAKSGP